MVRARSGLRGILACGAVFSAVTVVRPPDVAFATPLVPPPVSMVKDVNPSTSPSGDIGPIVRVGSDLYFFRANSGLGDELWKCDGTAAGTVRMRVFSGGSYHLVAAVGTTFFFTANDGVHGVELWRSDGSPSDTVMVRDIVEGHESTPLGNLTVVGTSLFFTADDGIHGTELWRSDGNPEGTSMVTDIQVGVDPATGSNASTPQDLTRVGRFLFFDARDASHGRELWKSDGTEAGTVLVKDIYSGVNGSGAPNQSYPDSLSVAGSILYFSAYDASNGRELWKSDGTEAGTLLVKDIFTGASGGSPNNGAPGQFVLAGSTVFFTAYESTGGRELWKTDGTSAGTMLVKDIYPGSYYGYVFGSDPNDFTVMGSVLFFSASDGTNGRELWKSDGTTAGTVLVKDINPGSGSGGLVYLCVHGDRLYFGARDDTHGSELWKSDGTTAGTVLVKDVIDGVASGGVSSLVPVDSTLYFSAVDSKGAELWKTDGTAAGTVNVTDLPEFGRSGTYSELYPVGDKVFFIAYDGVHGSELWVSDGTPGGTSMVKEFTVASDDYDFRALTAVGQSLYLAAWDGSQWGTWRSDGTTAGTVRLMPNGSTDFVAMGATVYFNGCNASYGCELWKTDGSVAGTVLVKDINPYGHSGPSEITVVGSTLYFRADDGVHGSELWKSDGTSGGTVLVTDLLPGETCFWGCYPRSSFPSSLVAAGSTLYFVAADDTFGPELWKSNGTAAGTVMVKDVNPNGYSTFGPMISRGSILYFAANDGIHGMELWKSNGTTAGTAMVKDVSPGSSNGYVDGLTLVGSTLYFSGMDTLHGGELWKSDGTFAGTVMVRDIASDAASADPLGLTAHGSFVYFSANDGAYGRELWMSDGTSTGTGRVADIIEGPGSSDPTFMASAGGQLFFAAVTEAQGRELWKADTRTVDTISWTATFSAKLIQSPFAFAAASATSGRAVTYSVTSAGTSGCTIPAPGTPSIRFTAAGTCTVTASTPDNSSYRGATATATVTVTGPPTLRAAAPVTQAALLSYLGARIPSGGRASMATTTPRVCAAPARTTNIVYVGNGSCVVTLTLTPRTGRATTYTITLVSRRA